MLIKIEPYFWKNNLEISCLAGEERKGVMLGNTERRGT